MDRIPSEQTAKRVAELPSTRTTGASRNRAVALVRAPVLAFAIIALTGCSASTAPPPPASGAAPSAPVPSVSPTLASPSANATVAPQLIECLGGSCPHVAPGAYVTGLGGFFPGLAIRIPAGWDVDENSPGELKLDRADHSGSALFLWKDVRVVVSNDRSAPPGTLVKEVAGTPEAIVKWLTTNTDFSVREQPKPMTIAGKSGTVLAVGVSETADSGEPGADCPSNLRCADIVGDPAHWAPPGAYGIGGDGTLRLFMTTLHYPHGDHLFAVGWQGDTAAEMRAFAVLTQPILDSIRVPDRYVSN